MGLVNVNLRPYYAEGLEDPVGYEIAEQLGWRLPDNVVCPMAGGSLIRKIRKAFNELIALGHCGRQTGKAFLERRRPVVPPSRSRSSEGCGLILSHNDQTPSRVRWRLAIPADGPAASKMIPVHGWLGRGRLRY